MNELAHYDEYNTMWDIQDCLKNEVNVHLIPQYANDNSDISKSMYSLISYEPTQVPFIEPRDLNTQLLNGCSFNEVDKYNYMYHNVTLQYYKDQPIASIGDFTRNPQSVIASNDKNITMTLHCVDLNSVEGFYLDNLVISPAYGDFIINFITAEPTVKFIADICKERIKDSYHESNTITIEFPLDLTPFIPIDVTSNYLGRDIEYDTLKDKISLVVTYVCEHLSNPEVARERDTLYKDLGCLYQYRYMDFYISHNTIIDGYTMPHLKSLHKFIFRDLYINNANIWDTSTKEQQVAYNRIQDRNYFVPVSLVESKSSAISILHDMKHIVKSLPLDLAQGFGHILSKEKNILNDERSVYHTLYGSLLSWFDNSVVTLQRMTYTLADACSYEYKMHEYRIYDSTLSVSSGSKGLMNTYYFIRGLIGIYIGFGQNTYLNNCSFETLMTLCKDDKDYLSIFNNLFITLQRQVYHRIQPGCNISHFNICQHNTTMQLLPVQDRYEQFKKYIELDLGSNSYNVSTPSVNYSENIETRHLYYYTGIFEQMDYLLDKDKDSDTDKVRKGTLSADFSVNTSYKQDENYIALEAFTLSDFIFRATSNVDSNCVYENLELNWFSKPFEVFDYDLSTLNNDMQDIILTYKDTEVGNYTHSEVFNYALNTLDTVTAKDYTDFAFSDDKDITSAIMNLSFLDLPVWYITFIDWSQIDLDNAHSYLDGYLVDISDIIKIYENHKSIHTKTQDYYCPNYINWKSLDCGFTNNQIRLLSLLTNLDNVLSFKNITCKKSVSVYSVDLSELKGNINLINTSSVPSTKDMPAEPSEEIKQMNNAYSNISTTFEITPQSICICKDKSEKAEQDNSKSLSYTACERGKILGIDTNVASMLPRNKIAYPKSCNPVYANLEGISFSLKNKTASKMSRVVMPYQVAPSKYLNTRTVSDNIESEPQVADNNDWVTDENKQATDKYTIKDKITMLCNKFNDYKFTNIFPVIRLKEEPNKAVIFTKNKVLLFDTGALIQTYALEISYNQISSYILDLLGMEADDEKGDN